jgi:hypothetical protein
METKNISRGFPNQLAPDSEKKTFAFGKKVGDSICAEWFGGTTTRYADQWNNFHELRLYARGEQPIQKYKDRFSIDGDNSKMNLDWSIVPVIPKFVDIVVNGMNERLFKVKAYAQDAISEINRKNYMDAIEGQMVAKPILEKIKEKTGADPFMMEPDKLPANDDELSLHMQIKYKPAIEIAEEVAINSVHEENDYDDKRKQWDSDSTIIGVAWGKHEFLPGSGIEESYVDPAYFIHSYSEDPHFKDCFYFGEVKVQSIGELYKINPGISKEDVEKIALSSKSWINENMKGIYNDLGNDTCTLLYFNYKTTQKVVYKKKNLTGGAKRLIEKDDSFNPSQKMIDEGNFDKLEKTIDVWYCGIMPLGGDALIKWELSENMVRPNSSSQHALPNYFGAAPRMYKGRIESIVRRMIPMADLVQLTHLKIQQVTNRIVPDGVFIDADGINEVDLGTGAAYTPEVALRLYFQTGSVIGRSFTGEGDLNHAKVPITQLTSNSGASKTTMLFNTFNHYLNMMSDVAGLSPRDASKPDPDGLVGLQKMASLNSNTATRHILDAGLYLFKSLSVAISYRIADILQYADFKEDFKNKIGKYNVAILDEIKDLYLYDFGIGIEISPDEEERAYLADNIKTALAKKDISLEDAIDINEIKNIKLALQLLKLKRMKKGQAEAKQKMDEAAYQSKTQIQIQQMAQDKEMKKIQAETESKLKLIEAQSEADIKKADNEAKLKSSLMREEFMYQMKLQGLEAEDLNKREGAREDKKTERINQQGEVQSDLLNQRRNNLPPKKFNTHEDNRGPLTLSEFEPHPGA